MEFEVEQGAHLGDLIKAAQGSGRMAERAQRSLDKLPKLTFYEWYFWRAYGQIATMRPPAMAGALRIPWDKIVEYAKYNEMGRMHTNILVRVITNMDIAYVNAVTKKQAEETAAK